MHCTQKLLLTFSARIMLIYKQLSSSCLSVIYLRAVNSHRFNQSNLDTRSWYHGTAASMGCLQASLRTPSSPDCFQLVPLALDYTRLSRLKPNKDGYLALSPTGSLFAGYPSCISNHVQCPLSMNCSMHIDAVSGFGKIMKINKPLRSVKCLSQSCQQS